MKCSCFFPVLAALSLLFFSSCTSEVREVPVPVLRSRENSCLALAHSGDLIVRSGRDEISRLFCLMNTRDPRYSHCGVLYRTDSGLYVYHIIGEGSNRREGQVQYEAVASFVNEKVNKQWAIIRYTVEPAVLKAFCDTISSFYHTGLFFDTRFDLTSNDKMYCSEMVYKAMLAATRDSAFIVPSVAQSGKRYIAIDNLYGNKISQTICEITY